MMSDAINRAVERKAWQIIKIEQLLVAFFAVATTVMLAASIYFEKTYGMQPFSFAFAALFFVVSSACFWILFRAFGGDLRTRSRRKGTRAMFMLASLYIMIASFAAYVLAYGMFGLQGPWIGSGRDNLYVCYFLLAVSSIFLARSVTFYWRLRAYILQSLGSLSK